MISGSNIMLGFKNRVLTKTPFDFKTSGNVTCLVGANGAGKTTLLMACLGEGKLSSGEIKVDEKAVGSLKASELAESFALVPQEHTFPGDLQLFDFLQTAYLSKVPYFGQYPKDSHGEIIEICSELGLSHFLRRSLSSLSTGERQRAFLGHALLQKPKFLLMDEPTNHLDPGGIEKFWECFLRLCKANNTSALISTHDVEFCRKGADWIVALKQGDLHFSGSTTQFFEEYLVTLYK